MGPLTVYSILVVRLFYNYRHKELVFNHLVIGSYGVVMLLYMMAAMLTIHFMVVGLMLEIT